ncbi:hypothetical protein ACK323_06730 [Aeromonas enteropelogenes]|uniref:hypothetical protein n=1 Tax=Aeromonas enteropelogenes TaxID=29489 RepID=UPI00398950C1
MTEKPKTISTEITVTSSDKSLKCGLIMPIAKSENLEPEHWRQVQNIIKESLSDTEFHIRMVSESDDVGVIHKSIVQNIYQDDIVICDVSTRNANVMFELGMRLAFDKPTVIIKDDVTAFSFDTQIIEHVMYKRDLKYYDIIDFKNRLREKVIATYQSSKSEGYSTFLKHFTIERVAKLDERTVGRDEYLMEKIDRIQHSVNSLERDMKSNSRRDLLRRTLGNAINDTAENSMEKLDFLDNYVSDFKKSLGFPRSAKLGFTDESSRESMIDRCIRYIADNSGLELSPAMREYISSRL